MSDTPDDVPTDVRAWAAPARAGARFTAGQLVGGRYRIVASLGRGGMGEVYRAEDTRLGQHVALKFLPADVAADTRMIDTLAAEVRVGRSVSHPNVCRLYDLVEADGVAFIAMEFVDGEDLASLLRRIGRLTGDKAIALAHDICAGVAAAHDAGVVHRDLKPSNIMIDGRGRARITDFGLAVGRTEARSRDFAGTPAYMAPEQLAGEPADVASDLYAIGTVLFEMFTGHRLFEASTADDLRALHRRAKPRPSSIVPEIDPAVERLILSCLDEEPQRRPSRVADLLGDLPSAGRASSRQAATPRSSDRQRPGSSSRGERSIAVLPFEDLSPEGHDESFSAGLAEEIISDLANIGALRVIARGSVMRFRGARELVSVARELQVSYLLTGSVRKAGRQLRLTANLVNGGSDEIVWSEKFKGSVDDIFDIQETVARTVAEQLKIALTAEESAKIAERPISNALAYEYYLRARAEIWKFSAEGLATALDQLQRGLDVVGDNVVIYSAMAMAHWQYFNAGIDPDDRHLQRAEETAQKIFAIDPESVHGHRALGLVAMSRGDLRVGLQRLRQAAAGDPHEVETLVWLCAAYLFTGLADEARPVVAALAKIDPFSMQSLVARIGICWTTGEFEAGMRLVEIGRPLHADAPMLQYFEAGLYAMTDQRDAAAAIYRQAAGHPDFVGALCGFLAGAMSGDRPVAFEALKPAEGPARNDFAFSVDVAIGLAALGETDAALDWLENALARGYSAWRFISEHHQAFAPLRSDSRFADVTTRMRQACSDRRREIGIV
jgi:serine/threonine-protein kinase